MSGVTTSFPNNFGEDNNCTDAIYRIPTLTKQIIVMKLYPHPYLSNSATTG